MREVKGRCGETCGVWGSVEKCVSKCVGVWGEVIRRCGL